jgi:hypothetical protein
VPDLMCISLCVRRCKESVQVRGPA